ncbi:MAG: hypothetical protein JXD23_13125 [Spirochaetales bacterium]|nr:hypothetical protein [Spirochaetales bacterium]
MEQLHCLLNCLIDILAPRADFRPLLFGSWDAPVSYTEDGYVTYFSYSISSKKYFDDFRILFGDGVTIWYDELRTKAENLEVLTSLLASENKPHVILAQVDLYHLYYEKSSYRRKHQPHFLIIDDYTPDGWEITDSYYHWQGTIPAADFSRAFIENRYGAGASIDPSLVGEAAPASVSRYFDDHFQLRDYPLVDALQRYIWELIDARKPFELGILESVFSQFRALYKTKISYSYAYSYFADAVQRPVQSQAELIDKFIKNWGIVTFVAIKSCIEGRKEQLIPVTKKVDLLLEQEKEIKEGLGTLYEYWKKSIAIETSENRLHSR